VSLGGARSLIVLLGCAACAGDALGPVTGTLAVSVNGAGDGADPDGFLVVVDGSVQRPLTAGGATLVGGLAAGSHQVALEGIGSNCTVSGAATREVTIAAGDTAGVAFDVACAAVRGTLRVTVTTSGIDLDPNGYEVLVDGAAGAAVEPDAAILFPVDAGDHVVSLGAVNPNCAVAAPASQPVRVTAGGLAVAEFGIQCAVAARAGREHEIAYVSAAPGSNLQVLYVVNDDGTHQERLFPSIAPPQDTPAWAPDGDRIAFYTTPSDSTVAVIIGDAGGTVLRQVSQKKDLRSASLDWSPDGARMALGEVFFDSCPVIRLFRLDGSGELPFDPGCFFDARFESFAWAPDGRRLAFVVRVIQDIDTLEDLGILGIADLSVPGESESPPEGCEVGDVHQVAWSPDGSRLAFTDAGIVVLDLATSSCVRLTDEPTDASPSWSPDSQRLAFSSSRDGNAEIYVIQADGSGLNRITRNPADDVTPSWRP
jgi:WD40 repeat protein